MVGGCDGCECAGGGGGTGSATGRTSDARSSAPRSMAGTGVSRSDASWCSASSDAAPAGGTIHEVRGRRSTARTLNFAAVTVLSHSRLNKFLFSAERDRPLGLQTKRDLDDLLLRRLDVREAHAAKGLEVVAHQLRRARRHAREDLLFDLLRRHLQRQDEALL